MLYVNARFFSQEVTGVQRFAIELSQNYVSRGMMLFFWPQRKLNIMKLQSTLMLK